MVYCIKKLIDVRAVHCMTVCWWTGTHSGKSVREAILFHGYYFSKQLLLLLLLFLLQWLLLPVMNHGADSMVPQQNTSACSGKKEFICPKQACMPSSQFNNLLYFIATVHFTESSWDIVKWLTNTVSWKFWKGCERLFRGKDQNSSLMSGFSTMTVLLHAMINYTNLLFL